MAAAEDAKYDMVQSSGESSSEDEIDPAEKILLKKTVEKGRHEVGVPC